MTTSNVYLVPFKPTSDELTQGELIESLTDVPGFMGLRCQTWVDVHYNRDGDPIKIPRRAYYAAFRSRMKIH